MSTLIFERFLSTASMIDAEKELLALEQGAIPVLESLLIGQAKNHLGVPYRQFGLAIRCALEVARRLGPIAKPLEGPLRMELRNGHFVAAMALGSLGTLEEASVEELVANLNGEIDMSYESAVALLKCGRATHPLVVQAASNDPKVAEVLARMAKHLSRRESQ